MTEPPLGATGPGNIWCIPQPKPDMSPIRRGTARRLGLRLSSRPFVVNESTTGVPEWRWITFDSRRSR